jgi:hypothetical protein
MHPALMPNYPLDDSELAFLRSVAPAQSDISSAVNVLRTVLYHGPIQPRDIGRMGIRKLSQGRRLKGRADNVM